MRDLITAQVLADALDLSVETIWRYTRTNKIPYVSLGERQYRYNLEEVVAALTGSAVREKSSAYQTDAKVYTYQDYLELPEEPGYHYEILNGQLIREPSPKVLHQRVSRELGYLLITYFRQADPAGEVFAAPLDVTIQDITVAQPDILYIAGTQRDILRDTRVVGAPTLAVEVISESSRRRDRLTKMKIYQQADVSHYWLVDPEEKTMECFALRNGAYTLIVSGMDHEVLEHPEFPGLRIPLADLWQE